MSDFLQFVDRIPTLPNRKKLTFDDQSIKYAKVEYADEPFEEGTFLNKANFNVLNSSLGYNECTNELVPVYTPKNFVDADFNEIVPNWTSTKGTLNNSEITGTLNTINDEYLGAYTPTYKITNTAGINFYNDSTTSSSQIRTYCRDGSSTNYLTAGRFLSVLNTKNADNNHIIYFLSDILTSRANKVTYEFDYKQNQTNKIIDFSLENTQNFATAYATIYVSNDGIDYTLFDEKSLYRSSSRIYQEYSINIGTYRYCKIELSHTSTVISINYLKTKIQTYEHLMQNQISTNVTNNYINNQRILIETPNYNISSIASNTIDDILCDTLLKPLAKYELIYDETNNRFNLGKLIDNTLLDITLTESVTQIQIDGLFDKFKTNVLYMCIVNGGANNNYNIYMGKNDTTGINLPTISSTTTPYNYVSFFSFSKKESNIVSWDSIYSNGSNYVSAHNNLSNPQDIIAIYGSSFIAGTRIIIKEVA